MRAKTVKTLLIALLVCVQIAAVVVVMLGTERQTKAQITRNAEEALHAMTASAAVEVERPIAAARAALELGVTMLSAGTLGAPLEATLERYFVAQLAAQPDLAALTFVRSDGSFLRSQRLGAGFETLARADPVAARGIQRTERDAGGGVLRRWIDAQAGDDARTQPWFEFARARAGAVVTLDAQIWSGNEPMLALARAVPGVAGGVLAVEIERNVFAARLAGLPFAVQGSIAIADELGRMVAHSDPAIAGRTIDGRLTGLERIGDAPLQTLVGALALDLPNENGALEQWRLHTGVHAWSMPGEADGDRIGIVQVLAPEGMPGHWLLMAQAPQAVFVGPLAQLFERRMTLLLAVVCLTALIGALALFGLGEQREAGTDRRIDRLTGFLVRSEFERRLRGMLENRRELEHAAQIVVVALDLDAFRQVNQRHGREAGDQVLREFALRLRDRVRQHDMLCRVAGDRFLLAMRLERRVDALNTVNRIRAAAIERAFSTPGGRHLLGLTAGVAIASAGESPQALLSRAEQALATGKARQRNRAYIAPGHGSDADWPQTRIVVRALTDTSIDPGAASAAPRIEGATGSSGQPPRRRVAARSPTLEI